MNMMRTAVATALVALGALSLPASAGATFPGKNGWLYISGHEPMVGIPDIFRVRPDGSGLKLLTNGRGAMPNEGMDPSASANAKRLSFTVGSQASSDVWVMSGTGNDPQQLTFPIADPACQIQGLDQMGGISPNGKRIAFMTTRETPCGQLNDHNIWTMRSDGSDPQVLLDSVTEDYWPEFGPDGRTVFMSAEISGALDIGFVTLAGAPHTSATHVTATNGVAERTPSVHPSGNRVAFWRSFQDIYAIGVNGTNEVPIATDPGVVESSPAYSPDGKRIAWIEEGVRLVIARADGSNPKPVPLPDDVQFLNQVDWASDTIRPRTTITDGPKGTIAKSKATFRFRSSEAASTFRCKLDSKPYKPCKSAKTYSGLGAGEHTFNVAATDFAGNRDRSPAKRSFTAR